MDGLLAPSSAERDKAIALQGFKFCMRYVDDCLVLSQAASLLPTPEYYGLQYSSKETGAESVVFCGVRANADGERIHVRIST